LRDRRDVEDAAQEAFLRAFGALSRFPVRRLIRPWIAQIVTRLCYDRLRPGADGEGGLGGPDPGERTRRASVAAGRTIRRRSGEPGLGGTAS